MEAALLVFSVPCAIVPSLALLGLVWWLDRFEREPWPLVLAAFAWGGAAAGATLLVAPPLLEATGWAPDHLAPLIEEPLKAAFLLALFRHAEFDNATDGFVYGAASGLGFALIENLLYFLDAAHAGAFAWATTVVMRSLYDVLMHACATATVGALVGLAKFHPGVLPARLPGPAVATALGLAGAVGLHAGFNGLFHAAAQGRTELGLLNLLLLPLQVATFLAVLQLSLLDERRILREQLADEADRGTLPRAHVPILSSSLQRRRRGWLPAGVDRHAYVVTATRLAFSRHRARTGGAHASLEGLRAQLRDLLGAS